MPDPIYLGYQQPALHRKELQFKNTQCCKDKTGTSEELVMQYAAGNALSIKQIVIIETHIRTCDSCWMDHIRNQATLLDLGLDTRDNTTAKPNKFKMTILKTALFGALIGLIYYLAKLP